MPEIIQSIWNEIKKCPDVATLTVEFIGLLFVVITLRKDKKIKQAEFIADYNFNFISSESLIEMERKLENCYQIYQIEVSKALGEKGIHKAGSCFGDSWFKKPCYNQLGLDYNSIVKRMKKMIGLKPVDNSPEPVKEDYQKLINYLVYLESFAPLVLTRQVYLKDIDDTFGYRYFIAMNNPLVQKYELLAESDYYRGCIRLYKKWYRYRKLRGLPIPMEWFALTHTCNCGKKQNPVYQGVEGKQFLCAYKRCTRHLLHIPFCRISKSCPLNAKKKR